MDANSRKRPRPDSAEGSVDGGGSAGGSTDDGKKARRREQKAAKLAKLMSTQQEAGGVAAVVTPQAATEKPFEALPEDAAETPFEAYRDIEPFLFQLAVALGKSKATLRIYDPYYCEGSMIAHLAKLGFTSVHNKKQDCYAVWREGRTPPFDVLVTNPPFSSDHMKRVLDFAVASGKPFFLLLPEFVEEKRYYQRYVQRIQAGPAHSGAAAPETAAAAPPAGSSSSNSSSSSSSSSTPSFPLSPPVYLGPVARPYQFSAPGRDLDGVKPLMERSHHAELPFQVFACKFQCVWYLQLGPHRASLVPWWRKKYEGAVQCALAEGGASQLPQLSKAAKAKAAAGGSRAEGNAEGHHQETGASGTIEPPPEPEGGGFVGAGGGMSRNAWRKKVSRQRKKAARAALDGGTSTHAGALSGAPSSSKKKRF